MPMGHVKRTYNKAQGMPLEQGILKAIKDCRADGTMAGFLERHHREVFGMVSLQWDEEKAREFYGSEARAVGRAEGRAEGKEATIIATIRNLMETLNLTSQQAMDAMKISVTEQSKYVALL